MTGTMSSASSEWVQFYQNNHFSGQPRTTSAVTTVAGDVVSDATAVATTNVTSSNTATHLGRVSRTTNRRRSRASRRTPTTLLNTDTTNFRAMVQQFTGGGGGLTVPPFENTTTNFNFGLGPTSSVVGPTPATGFNNNLQFQQPQGSQLYHMLSRNDGGTTHSDHHQHALFQRLQSYSTGSNREGSDGFVIENDFSSHVPPNYQGKASSSHENVRDKNYMF